MRYDVAARTAAIVLLLTAAAAVLFARPAQLADRGVRPSMITDVDATLIGQYVRVIGMFRPDETMKRYLRLNDVLGKGYGPNFAALIDPSSGALLWVREDASLTREANASATLIGRISVGVADEPPLYLLPQRPPIVVAAEWAARLGLVVLGLCLVIFLVVLGAQRIQFALPSLWHACAAAGDSTRVLFYGGLGYMFDDLQVRAAPVRCDVSVHEVRISAVEPSAWHVVIHRVTLIDVYDIASDAGPLAGMWMRFEDDRGLLRTAVLATQSERARAEMIEMLSNLRA